MTQHKIQHLDSLSVVQIDFNIWSGQTKLRPEDVTLGVGGELPPEKVAQLGSKKIIDTKRLNVFHTLKTEARRMLARYGLPFMNGYAIPVDKTVEVCERLDAIAAEFESQRQLFIQDYNAAVDQWVIENPGFEQAIRSGAMDLRDVQSRIGFEYQLFRVAPMEDQANANRLGRKVESLGDDLIDEVVKTATTFYNERLLGQKQLNIATRQTLLGIRNKIDGLSFLNGAFAPLVQLLDETIQGYAEHAVGRFITEPYLWKIVGAVLIMSDRSRIENYAQGKVTVDSMSGLVQAEKQQITASHSWNIPADAAKHEQSMQAGLDPDDGGEEPGVSEPSVCLAGAETTETPASVNDAALQEIDAFFKEAVKKAAVAVPTVDVQTSPLVTPPQQPQPRSAEAASQAPIVADIDQFYI